MRLLRRQNRHCASQAIRQLASRSYFWWTRAPIGNHVSIQWQADTTGAHQIQTTTRGHSSQKTWPRFDHLSLVGSKRLPKHLLDHIGQLSARGKAVVVESKWTTTV